MTNAGPERGEHAGARIAGLVAAFLAGASGLGIQALLASTAALPLGSGTGPALALAAFLSAWSLGAWTAGRARWSAWRILRAAGVALAVVAPAAEYATLRAGPLAALVAIAAVGFAQGLFLPALARGRTSAVVALLVAANLAGAWLGAGWIADVLVHVGGRMYAAVAAGGCALVAGLAGVVSTAGLRTFVAGFVGAARLFSPGEERADDVAPADARSAERANRGASSAEIGPLASALVVGLGTAWMGGVEWSLLRIGTLWFGGMQDALTAVLAASLAALALGAATLPPILPRGARGVALALALCALGSTWILAAHHALPHVAGQALWIRALVLCAPALAPFGALVPLAHRATAGESGARLGRLYLHEAWGAWIGIPLVQFVLTPQLGLAASVGVTCALGVVAAVAVASRAPAFATLGGVSALAAAFALARAEPPALHAPPLANPALTVLSFAEDRDFAVSVVDDGLLGERTLLTDGFRAAGTGRDYRYMRVLGHLPLLLHPDPRRVAVLALGTGTTVGAVSLHPEVERIDVLEIARAVVAAAPLFAEHNRGALAEGLPGLLDADDGQGRVVVKLGDGRKTLRDSPATYDVVTMEPLLPDSPFGVHLYTEEAYADVRRALKPGGIACQWVPPHALEPDTYHAVRCAFLRAFAWSMSFVSGTQEILIGSEREPSFADARFPVAGDGGALAVELRELGLDTPEAACARLAHFGGLDTSSHSYGDRRLRDLDPWISYRPRRVGAELLLDLANNLPVGLAPDRIRLVKTSALQDDLARGANALREARRAHAALEAGLRGVALPDGATIESSRSARAEALARATVLAPEDPEVREFAAELAFLDDLRAGVAALANDPSRDAAVAALDPLTRAAQARKERADVHAYVAVALSRLGSPAAEKAWTAALQRCPRLAETDIGRRARDLGLADDLWKRAVANALLASVRGIREPR